MVKKLKRYVRMGRETARWPFPVGELVFFDRFLAADQVQRLH